MPRLLVLGYLTGGTERLMVETAGVEPRRVARPPGVRVLGELRVPLSTQLVTVSPPVLRVPGHGTVAIATILSGEAAIPGVAWLPAG